MSQHTIYLDWHFRPHPNNTEEYCRNHTITLSGNQIIQASAAIDFMGAEAMADPEQMFVSAVSSCHMLFFLAIAKIRKFPVASYKDEATAYLESDDKGGLSVTRILLRPTITFLSQVPSSEVLERMHDSAHKRCFIAKSIKGSVTIEPTKPRLSGSNKPS